MDESAHRSEENHLLEVLRLSEAQRISFGRAVVERCELWIVAVTLIPWLVCWSLVLNFYPTDAMMLVLKELVERAQ